MTRQPADRIEWIDGAKGIGIALVVFGHVLRGLVTAGLIPADNAAFRWFDFSVYTFHMPLFFFLSGLTAEGSLRKGRRQFMAGRLRTILYPYILWSLMIGSLLIPFSTGDIKVTDLALIPVYPVSIFWFLYVLFMCHVVFALWPKQHRHVLLILSAVLLVAVQFVPPESRKIWPPLFHFARLLPFYLAGYFLSGRVLKDDNRRATPIILTGLLAGAIAGAHLIVGWEYMSIIALPAGLLGVGLVIAIAKRINGRAAHMLGILGASSMTIYVTHTVIGAAVRKALSVLHIDIVAVHLIVGTAVAIGLPLIAHLVMKRLGVLHIVGLGAPPKPATQPAKA